MATSPYTSTAPPNGVDVRTLKTEARPAGDGVPSQSDLKAFIDRATGVADAPETNLPGVHGAPQAASGGTTAAATAVPDATEAAKTEAFTEQTFAKVAAFLDPNTAGPITLLVVRHKVFVMRIPTQQEILDVGAVLGRKVDSDSNAAVVWSIIGELKKACLGWLPEKSPQVQTLRANIAWPEKWLKAGVVLFPEAWTETRDPQLLGSEITPLWKAYQEWRTKVIPTEAELDFYYASLS